MNWRCRHGEPGPAFATTNDDNGAVVKTGTADMGTWKPIRPGPASPEARNRFLTPRVHSATLGWAAAEQGVEGGTTTSLRNIKTGDVDTRELEQSPPDPPNRKARDVGMGWKLEQARPCSQSPGSAPVQKLQPDSSESEQEFSFAGIFTFLVDSTIMGTRGCPMAKQGSQQRILNQCSLLHQTSRPHSRRQWCHWRHGGAAWPHGGKAWRHGGTAARRGGMAVKTAGL
eukprot:gene17005-biopygen11908